MDPTGGSPCHESYVPLCWQLGLIAFAAALLLGSFGGILSTGQFLDGAANGAPPLDTPWDELPDFVEMPALSPAEALVALVFRPPGK